MFEGIQLCSAEQRTSNSSKAYFRSFILSLLAILTLLSSIFFKSSNPINFFGLIAMGSIKLLPAIQQVFLSISQIKAHQASLLRLSDLIDETNSSKRIYQKSSNTYKLKKSLRFENVFFKYSKTISIF